MYKLIIDNSIDAYGETTDFDKLIKINVKRGDIVNTLAHERLHEKHPRIGEWKIRRMATKLEREMPLDILRQIDKIIIKYIND